jgi:hypothetical protein
MKIFHDKKKFKYYMTKLTFQKKESYTQKMKINIVMKGWELLNLKGRADK